MNSFIVSNRRYIGGKSLLTKHIFDAIPKKYQKGTFFDVFAGTGVVADAAINRFDKIIVNDLLFSNEVIYNAFFAPGRYSKSKIETFRELANTKIANQTQSNYFEKNFGNKFFSKKSARQIGNIRQAIEDGDYTIKEKAILIASLLYSADRIANTVGHYEAFRKKDKDFKNFTFRLVSPYKDLNFQIYRQDSNLLVRKIACDVAYIDPPYNSRQYSRFYHVLETLTKWDMPKLSGVALKPPLENLSKYCTVRAPDAFEDLVKNLDAKLIIVSYNNTYKSKSTSSKNKIALNQITRIMKSKGLTRVIKIQHKFFSAGNTDFDNHLEYLFVTEVHK